MLEARYINKTQMRKINSTLKAAGFAAYPGDRTGAKPSGCGAGYVANLVNYVAGADPDAQKQVKAIVREITE